MNIIEYKLPESEIKTIVARDDIPKVEQAKCEASEESGKHIVDQCKNYSEIIKGRMSRQNYDKFNRIKDSVEGEIKDYSRAIMEAKNDVFDGAFGTSLKPLQKSKGLKNRGFMTFDIETNDGLRGKDVFCWSLAYYEQKISIDENGRATGSFTMPEVLQGTSDDFGPLFEKINNKDKRRSSARVIYVQNLGFDIRHIMQYCAENKIECDPPIGTSKILAYYIPSYNVKFIDSLQFLFTSQEKAEIEWEVEEHLRKIDCKDIFNKPYADWSDSDKRKVLLHNKNDVIALLEIMNKFRKTLWDLTNVDVLTCLSLASMAMKAFRKLQTVEIKNPFVEIRFLESEDNNILLEGKKKRKERPTYVYNKFRDDFVRKSYHGGRTEVFQLGYFKNVTVLDVVSLYPDVMNRCAMPAGYGCWEVDEQILQDCIQSENSREGFIECYVVPPENIKYPVLGQMRGEKEIERNFQFTCLPFTDVFTLVELRAAYKRGYKIYPKCGLLFDSSTEYFSNFVTTMIQEKINSKGGRRHCAKIILNSTYGKFGQKFLQKMAKYTYLLSEKEVYEFIEKNGVCRIKGGTKIKNGGNLFIHIASEERTMVKVFQNVAIASYICANARLKLLEQMELCDSLNIPVLDSDTDSIFIPSEFVPLLKLGTNLGDWDAEHVFDEILIFAPKCYAFAENKEFYLKKHGNLEGYRKFFIKMKGIERHKLNEIADESNSLFEIGEKLRKPIQMAEKYMGYKEAHRFGVILGTKKPCKFYSFKNQKREFLTNGTSKPWTVNSLALANENNCVNIVPFVMDSYKLMAANNA